MTYDPKTDEPFDVSPRFGQRVLARILKLELDANMDEKIIPTLLSPDHQRRQRKLVALQRDEADRLRVFLRNAQVRQPELNLQD